MGVYSTDRHGMSDTSFADEVIANESFDHLTGPARAILEMHVNDMAIFEAVILNDMDTVRKVNEGVLLEAELAALNEASAKSIFEAISAFLERIAEKIKGMVQSFIKKMDLFITRDTSKFSDKYGAELKKKDLSDFKYKFREHADNGILCLDVTALLDEYHNIFWNKFKDLDTEQTKTLMSEYTDNETLLRTLLETTISGLKLDNAGEFHDKCFNALFKEEKEITGLSNTDLNDMLLTLSISNDLVKLIKKSGDKDVAYLKKMAKEMKTRGKDKEDKDLQYLANSLYKVTTVAQTATVKAYSVWMEVAKFDLKQSRAVVSKAVMYNPKAANTDVAVVKTESALEDYCYDVAMDEADSFIDEF